RALPGADALLFYLFSPCKIESSGFVSSLAGRYPGFFVSLFSHSIVLSAPDLILNIYADR
ncbi:hypothetical protein ACRJ4Z_004409, partial [Yersinia enterocolitica]